MGFWSSVGSAVGSAAKGMMEATQEAKALSLEWSGEGDDFLFRKFKNGSMTEKMAANAVFRERYPDEDMRKEAMSSAMRRI